MARPRTTTSPRTRSRARIALAALTATLLTVLAGCGETESPDGGGDGKATRTIRDTFNGDVPGVPVKPERVVALWRVGTELADLGVRPVAALEGEFVEEELGSETYAKYREVPTVGSWEGVDVEKVIEADPDLIVGMDNSSLGIDYQELAEIAPTVILDIAEPTDVWDNYPQLADVVGKATDYRERNARLDQDLAEISAEFGDRIGEARAVSLNVSEGKTFVDTSKSLTWRRLDAAGFDYLPHYADDPARYVEELSSENIPDLAGADVVFYETDLHGEMSPDTRQLVDSASFQRLPAVRAGHVYPLSSGTIYTFPAGDQQVADLRAAAEDYRPSGS